MQNRASVTNDYPVRMRACADLAAGSKACLIARRRTGLSR